MALQPAVGGRAAVRTQATAADERQVLCKQDTSPAGPSTQYLRSLVPKTILLIVFVTRVLEYRVLEPSG